MDVDVDDASGGDGGSWLESGLTGSCGRIGTLSFVVYLKWELQRFARDFVFVSALTRS